MKRYLYIIGIIPLGLLVLFDFLERKDLNISSVYFTLSYVLGIFINLMFLFNRAKVPGRKIYFNYFMVFVYFIIWYLSSFQWGSF